MSLKPSDIDYIIDLLTQIAEALTKTNFLTPQERSQLHKYHQYEQKHQHRMEIEGLFRTGSTKRGTLLWPYSFDKEKDEHERRAINYDAKISATLKDKLLKAKQKYVKSTIEPLQKKLVPYLAPRWAEILRLSDRRQFRQDIEAFLNDGHFTYFFIQNIDKFCQFKVDDLDYSSLKSQKEKIVDELERIKAKLEYQNKKSAETEQKDERSKIVVTARTSKENWEAIRGEYDISKMDFGKKINFVSGPFKRDVIFRDVEHAFVLASHGFSKPALILAGGVIEELLRLYLKRKRIKPKNETFFAYIEACEDNRLLKRGVYRLSDSIRDFRNLVHLENEKTKRHTVSKATAKGAVSSIFTIANDFQ